MDRNRLSVSSDSLFKELAFNSCKPDNTILYCFYCQYFILNIKIIIIQTKDEGIQLMLNLSNILNKHLKKEYLFLAIIIYSGTLLMPKTCTADSARAIIGPMSVLGNLSVPEQQILSGMKN